MEAARKWLPYILILALIAIIAVLYFRAPEVVEKEIYIPGKEVVKHIPGVPDTTIKLVPYPVYIETPPGEHFGKDSSTYTVINDHGRVDVTTFPATDSTRVEVELIVPERLIFKTDSVLVNQVDTLIKYNTVTVDQPWYDTFLSGFITAILAVTGVIGAFAL